MAWGINKNASNKEKLKAAIGDVLNGYNSTGVISFGTYSDLYDEITKLIENAEIKDV